MKLRGKFRVTKIKGKTSAKVFNTIKVGDIISFMVPIVSAGSNRGRSYAIDIRVENTTTGEVTYKTFNQIDPILKNFEFEEVTNEGN